MCLAFGLTVDVFELITDLLILNEELPAEPSGNGKDVLFSLDLSCLPIFGCFEQQCFSQCICSLDFKERIATSWLMRCFNLSFP